MHCSNLIFKRLWTAGARSKSKADVILQQLNISDTKLTHNFQCDHHQLVTEHQQPNLLKSE